MHGSVTLSGAKNAASKILLATMLSAEPSTIDNVPLLGETDIAAELIEAIGGTVDRNGHRWTVATPHIKSNIVPQLSRRNRLPILTLGMLVNRTGQAEVPVVGGDAIGPRPVNYHLAALKAMGAEVESAPTSFRAKAKRLHGTTITLPYPSVGATENIMMAAVLATGTTLIRNAAREPEIVDLQNMLNLMGARISGAGGEAIRIEGVRRLHGVSYVPIPDRIEAGTLMVAAAITSGQVEVSNCVPDHLHTLIDKLRQAGCTIEEGDRRVFVEMDGRPRAVDCVTLPYPGFPTDLQPPLMSLAAIADGTSAFLETIYEQRFNQAEGLQRMGADISITGQRAFVHGVERLRGAAVRAHDLRAGAALVLAGLVADGVTTVSGIEHIDRGYDGLETKLTSLGASVRRACA